MEILIRTLDGETHKLEVTPSDSIHSIKEKLHDRHGIDTTQQRLVFAGVECLNDQTLEACHIVDGSTIHLVVTVTASLPVTIELQNGRKLETNINPSDTVATVKAQIQHMVFPGVVLLEHQLSCGDQLLEEDAVMASYEFPEKTLLQLDEANTTNISVVWPNRKSTRVKISEYRDRDTLQSLLQSTCQFHYGVTPRVEDLQVFYKGFRLDLHSNIVQCGFMTGDIIHAYNSTLMIRVKTKSEVFDLSTQPTDTVGDLSMSIFEQTGEPPNLNVLNVDFAGHVLECGQPLCKYGVHDGDQIDMSPKPPIKLNIITSPDNSMSVKIRPSATIGHLRMKIEELLEDGECAEDPSAFILKYGDTLLSSHRKVCYYSLQDDSEIKLLYACKVFIRTTTGKKYVVKALPIDAVRLMKEDLFCQTAIPISDQILFNVKSDQILNDDSSLSDYNIQDGDELKLQTDVRFQVIDNKNQQHEVIMKPSARIEAIKSSLESTTGINGQDQLLMHQSLELRDDEIVGQCEFLVRGGSIKMTLKKFEVKVNTGDIVPLQLSIPRLGTIRTLKVMLGDECKFPVDEMLLFCRGIELLDEEKMWQCGIHDSTQEIRLRIVPPLLVKDPNGRVMSISVKEGAKMSEVGAEIERIYNRSRKEWMLCRGGHKVDDGEIAGRAETVIVAAAIKAIPPSLCELNLQVRTIRIRLHNAGGCFFGDCKVTEKVRQSVDRIKPGWQQCGQGRLSLQYCGQPLRLDLTWLQQDIISDKTVCTIQPHSLHPLAVNQVSIYLSYQHLERKNLSWKYDRISWIFRAAKHKDT